MYLNCKNDDPSCLRHETCEPHYNHHISSWSLRFTQKSLSPKPLEDKNIMPQASPSHLSTGKATGIIVVSASPEPFFTSHSWTCRCKKWGEQLICQREMAKTRKQIHKHRLMYINVCSKNTCWAIKVGDPSPTWSILESHFEDPCDGWHLRCVAGFYSWLMAKSIICVNMWYLFCHASWQICTRNTELEFERGFQTAMSKSIQSSLDSAQKDRSFENNMKKWFHCSAMESSKNKRGFWVKLIIVHQPEICWFRLLVRLPFWVKLVIHFKIIAQSISHFFLMCIVFCKRKSHESTCNM